MFPIYNQPEDSITGTPSLGASNKTENAPSDSVPSSPNTPGPAFISSSVQAQIQALKRLMSRTEQSPRTYSQMPAILTQLSIDLSPTAQENVLVFISNPTSPSAPRDCPKGSLGKPDLVAFLADRNTAAKVVRANISCSQGTSIIPSSVHSLSSVVEIVTKDTTDDPTKICLHHLSILSRHKPQTFIHHGLVFDNSYFELVSLNFDKHKTWPRVYWTDEGYIDKFCHYLTIIIEESRRKFLPEVPSLVSAFNVGSRAMGIYSTVIHGERYHLLPIFIGRGNSSRRALVAIGYKPDKKYEKRIFKYSWHKGPQLGQELSTLKELKGTAGVV